MLSGLLRAEQLIRTAGLIAAIAAGLFSRPFPPEHETDPANPALAGRGKPYRWGTYLAALMLTAAIVQSLSVWIYVVRAKPVWAIASLAGAVLSLAGSIELFRRSWRGVFLFFAWCVFLWLYAMLSVRREGGSARWLFSGVLNGLTIGLSAVYFGRRKSLMRRSD